MSLKLADHLFTGPFPIDTTEIRSNQVPVVYAIVAKGGQPWAPVFRIVDVGATPDKGLRFCDHPRRQEWRVGVQENLGIYLFYAPRSKFSASQREQLASELRALYEPPHGIVG